MLPVSLHLQQQLLWGKGSGPGRVSSPGLTLELLCGPLDSFGELGVGRQTRQAGWSSCQGWHPSDWTSCSF